jgi:type I restriction enzyme S subunit
VSKRKTDAAHREAALEREDDIALAKTVRARAHEPTIQVGPDDLLNPDETSGEDGTKVEEMRADYRISPDPVGWVRPEAVTHHEEAARAWSMLPLKELGAWVGGGTPSKAMSAYWETGSIPWVSPKDMKTERIHDSQDHITEQAVSESTANLIPPGSVLLVTRSGILRHTLPVAVTAVPVTVNQDLKALTPKEGILPEYVAWALRAFSQVILNTCSKQGTTVNSLETSRLLRFEIPVAPLAQQKRIVAEIEKQFSRLDEAVANLKRVKANLKRYKAAVLKAAVEGRLVETEAELARRERRSYETGEQLLQRILETRRSQWQGKGKYKEPTAPDTTDLPELPEGWVWASWEMVLESTECAFKRGPFGSALTKAIFVEKGFKVYEQYCPINDDCSFARYYITPEKFEELRAFEVKAGDYLISCSGVTLGRITRVPDKFERGIINQALLRVRINEACINDQYFLHLFRSALFQKSIFDNSSGSAIPNVKGVKELKAMAIPLPNLAEQKRIIADVDRRFSLLRESHAQVDANLQRAERLRHSILHKSFSTGI